VRDAAFVLVAPVPALSPHQAVPKIITVADCAERKHQAEAHGDGQHRQKAGELQVYGTSLPKTPAILDLVWLIILSVGFT